MLAFLVLGVAVVGFAAIGIRRYRMPMNPITAYAIATVGLYTLLSGAHGYYSDGVNSLKGIPPRAINETVAISGIQMAGFILPFLVFRRPKGVGKAIQTPPAGPRLESMAYAKLAILLGGAAVCFLGLLLSDGGSTWITDPRRAYQYCRTGAGHFWSPMQWFLEAALFYALWAARPNAWQLAVILIPFTGAAYFSGSKGSLLNLYIAAIIYYNFFVARLSTLLLTVISVSVGIGGMLVLLNTHHDYSSTLDALEYFDYFRNSAEFIDRWHEFDGYYYGYGLLSSFWFYVPRSFYPEKPIEYGATLIQQVIWPGRAERTYTPGVLNWSLAYLDLGAAGVFLDGVFEGVVRKTSFEYFLRHRNSFLAFVLMMQFSMWQVWYLSPAPLALLMCVALAVFVKLRLTPVAAAPGRPAPQRPHYASPPAHPV